MLICCRKPLQVLILICGLGHAAIAQHWLESRVSMQAENMPVKQVLVQIGNQGGFSFSYNSDLLPADSLVTVSARQNTVRQILTVIFGNRFQYKEKGNFVIIQQGQPEKFLTITGHVSDLENNSPVDFASVYSRRSLQSSLTDDQGAFSFKVRTGTLPMELTVSKIGYADTTLSVTSSPALPLTIPLRQQAISLDTLIIRSEAGGKSWITRLFVSSRLRAHNRNINRFFTSAPFQIALTPGLSTHGKLASKVESRVSLNIYGGYNGGVNGVEIGGLFNISKADVQYLQAATTFNLVYGRFRGLQLGGIYNQVLGPVSGVQASALVNLNSAQLRGVQLASVLNYTKHLKGVQIGMVNISETSSGFSLGIVNIVKHGAGSIYAESSELSAASVTWKSGNKRLYNLLSVCNAWYGRSYSMVVGIGVGKDLPLGKKVTLENQLITYKVLFGALQSAPVIFRLQSSPQFQVSKYLSLFAGPSLSVNHHKKRSTDADPSTRGLASWSMGSSLKAWLGWQGGLIIHYMH